MRRRAPLSLQSLESRIAPATFTVQNLNDSGAGSLREAIGKANAKPDADKITFRGGLTGAITLTSGGYLISTPLEINGAGKITIDANHASSIFSIDDLNDQQAIPVTLRGLTLTRGSELDGGAIASTEFLTVQNCKFIDNRATAFDGGAILQRLGKLTVNASTFINNTAVTAGGAISLADTTQANLITGCTFTGNSVSGPGSAGGAIGSTGAQLSILSSRFSLNRATDANGDGGGLLVDGGSVTVAGSTTLSGNSAGRDGGGIFVRAGTLAVTDSGLSKNAAGRDGGGIGNASGGTLNVATSTLSENTAGRDGGGILNLGTLTVAASTLSKNAATGGDGGGISNSGTATVTGSTLSDNSAKFNSGGIDNNASSTLTVTGSTLSDNSAESKGGGIGNDGTATVTGSTLSGNSANSANGFGGGGIHNGINCKLTVSNSTLSGNSAGTDGGGIVDVGTAEVFNSVLSGNSANGVGGGILSVGTATTVTNSTLSGNSANGFGGGIYNSLGTTTLTNATLVNNRADADASGSGRGGGIWTFDHSFTVTRLFNTIVAGNALGGGTASDLAGKDVEADSANNLVGDPATAGGLTHGTAGNVVGTDDGNGGRAVLPLALVLDPVLRNNGGPTQTHALLPGSPALDAGATAAAGSVNLARLAGAGAVQSSTLNPIYPADKAIDGDLNNFSHTDGPSDLTPSWTLTLAAPAKVGQVVLHNRNILQYRLRDITIQLLNSSDAEVANSGVLNPGNNLNGPATLTFDFGGVTAAKVKVTRAPVDPNLNPSNDDNSALTLAEVQVFTPVSNAPTTDQRGAGFPRTVNDVTDIGAYEMPRALFADTFERPNSATLGSPWANQVGALGVATSRAQGAGTATQVHLASVGQVPNTANVDLYATVAALQPGQEAGLVARYAGPRDATYYLAALASDANGSVSARIALRNAVGGELVLSQVENVTLGAGQLRFRVVGTTLQLFLNGTLLLTKQNTVLAAGGGFGIRTVGTAAVDNFLAAPLATGVETTASFDQPAGQVLNDPWYKAVGYYTVTDGGAIQGGLSGVNLAVLNGVQQADVDAQVNVSLPAAGNSAGLVARYAGPGDKSYYLARLTRTAAGFTAELLRNSNGTLSAVAGTKPQAITPAGPSAASAQLRFVVSGIQLRVFVNSAGVFDVLDNIPLPAGTVGVRSDDSATLDDFHVSAVTTQLPFEDNFDGADGQSLGLNWTRQLGNLSVTGNQLGGPAGTNFATLGGVQEANVEVQADVTLTATNQGAGLIACFSGTGISVSAYTAQVFKTATGFKLAIGRQISGVVTTLTSAAVPALTGPIKFRVVGVNLTLLMNDVVQLTAVDGTLPAGGVGIATFGLTGVKLDNFSAKRLPFLPFTDDFSAAAPDANLLAQAGGYATSGGKAVGTATGKTPVNLAVLAGRLGLADVDVSASVSVANTKDREASLVARYTGKGDAQSSMYLATLAFDGTNFVASISKRVNGKTTELKKATVASGTGTLRFTVIGGQLDLYVDGASVLTVYDFTLKTGSAGIRSTFDASFNNLKIDQGS